MTSVSLVTGAAGFIGSNLVEHLLDKDTLLYVLIMKVQTMRSFIGLMRMEW